MTNNQTNVLDTLHGLGLPPSLDAAEAQTWRRWLPGGRVPWRELAGFETEIAKLEERRREVERERDEIAARLQGAPAQDVEARTRWERSGRRGARPEPRSQSSRPSSSGARTTSTRYTPRSTR